MKLVHKITSTTLVEILDHKLIHHNRFLEKQLLEEGISIPPYLEKLFLGKKTIFPHDKLFLKAFVEIYIQENLLKAGYIVKES